MFQRMVSSDVLRWCTSIEAQASAKYRETVCITKENLKRYFLAQWESCILPFLASPSFSRFYSVFPQPICGSESALPQGFHPFDSTYIGLYAPRYGTRRGRLQGLRRFELKTSSNNKLLAS